MEDIGKLEEELASLPRGYISNKKINGKIRHYRQWNEGGKIVSRYVPDSEYEETVSLIARRREVEAILKELRKTVRPDAPDLSSLRTEMTVLTGDELLKYASYVSGWRERELCRDIRTYIYGKTTPRVCVLYGLRRTGKTTMVLQVIRSMTDGDLRKSAYIKVRRNQTMVMLDRDLRKLYKAGFRYIFIDEATFMDDFVDTASFLADIYASLGMKIVISGTDSLGLWFANREELYDRTYLIHTTWIPYREHARLLGTDDIDEYIRYGGTLRVGETDFDDPELKNEEVSFRDDETARRYIDTAIAGNIQHSLKCYENGEHFRHLRDLYLKGELTGAVNRVIESMNHRFVLDVLTRDFTSNDLSLAGKNLLREKDPAKRTDILDRIDVGDVTGRLMEILEIRNADLMKTGLTEDHVREIREYLKALELIDVCPVRYMGSSSGYGEQIIITQPGMRYCQAQALISSLMKDRTFDGISDTEKEYVTRKILDEVKGRMMEEIIWLETVRRGGNRDVFKLVFDAGEFDMVVYDRKAGTAEIYEIKHSSVFSPEQYRHITDPEKCALTESGIGRISGRYVIYRGMGTVRENGVEYINASDYLSGRT